MNGSKCDKWLIGTCLLLAIVVGVQFVWYRDMRIEPTKPPVDLAEKNCKEPKAPKPLSAVEIERDRIFSLLAYAIAEKGWQSPGPNYRGHNIAAVLVDEQNQIKCWSRNAMVATRNATEHAEVRLIRNYLGTTHFYRLHNHRVYVTLEPCAMCAGMLALARVAHVTYGLSDNSRAFERLAFNSSSQGGYCPYRYQVNARQSDLSIGSEITSLEDNLRKQNVRTHGHPEVRALFEKAVRQLDQFNVMHDENLEVLKRARSFLNQVPAEYTETPYKVACKV